MWDNTITQLRIFSKVIGHTWFLISFYYHQPLNTSSAVTHRFSSWLIVNTRCTRLLCLCSCHWCLHKLLCDLPGLSSKIDERIAILGESLGFDYRSQEYFTSIPVSLLKTLICVTGAEYLGLLLIKCGDPQSYSKGHKRSIFTSVSHEIPNFCVPRMVSHFWIWLQIISNGQIMLCRKNSFIFQSNTPCTCTLCTFWGLGITPKTPYGGHTSLGMTQQSQRITLSM